MKPKFISSGLILGVIFSIAGGAVFFSSYSDTGRMNALEENGTPVTATLISIDERHTSGDSPKRMIHVPQYEYSDSKGQKHKVSGIEERTQTYEDPSFEVGDTAEALYDPSNPSNAMIAGDTNSSIATYAPLLFVAIGFGVIISSIVGSFKKARLQENSAEEEI